MELAGPEAGIEVVADDALVGGWVGFIEPVWTWDKYHDLNLRARDLVFICTFGCASQNEASASLKPWRKFKL